MTRNRATDEQRQAMLHIIRPEWSAMSSQAWIPKGKKPTTERPRQEIFRRANIHHLESRPRPVNWSWKLSVECLADVEQDVSTQTNVVQQVAKHVPPLPSTTYLPHILPSSNKPTLSTNKPLLTIPPIQNGMSQQPSCSQQSDLPWYSFQFLQMEVNYTLRLFAIIPAQEPNCVASNKLMELNLFTRPGHVLQRQVDVILQHMHLEIGCQKRENMHLVGLWQLILKILSKAVLRVR